MKTRLFFTLALLNFAISANAFSGNGNGTPDVPYLITTAEQLNEVRNDLSASYRLGADIDLTAWINANSPTEGWEPIGYGTLESPNPFKGTFDGAGHFITGIWSNRPDHNYVGLFGQVTGIVEFKNLGIIVAEGKSIKGQENVGGIAGWLTNIETTNTATITNCVVIGVIEGTKSVGGLVGLANWMHLTIENCYAAGSIVSTGDGAGGLLGSSWGNVSINITHSYAVNSVRAGESFSAGGIVGSSSANSPGNIWIDITDNVAINPTIDGGTLKRIVAFAKSGANLNLSNYAFAGILLNGDEEWFGELTNNSGQDVSLSQIKDVNTYTNIGWDFQTVWAFGNESYPLPVLNGLSKSLQPTVAPEHVSGGSSIVSVNVSAFDVEYKEGQLTIRNKPANTPVEIYDYSGRLLSKKSEAIQNISSLASGIYLIKVDHQVIKIVKK